jgi:drug/metabolite transporter (DMT)-like permease
MTLVVSKSVPTDSLNKKSLIEFSLLGITGFTLAQGLQSLSLFYLPAVSVTFLLNFTPLFVLVFGVILLDEKPSRFQMVGILIIFSGAYLFFSNQFSKPSIIGLLITIVSGIGWALYMVYGRSTLISERGDVLQTTAFSMSIGTIILLIVTYLIEGISVIPLKGWLIIVWLGVINTSVAFLLWNYALKRLKAFETSVIQNTMLIQIGLLSWVFLDEKIGFIQLVAIVLVLTGVLIVQLKH